MKSIGAGLSCFALCLSLSASAATYYVSPKGDDEAAGSENQPLRTIQRAADMARAGDSVLIEDGLYREAVLIRASGTEKAPIRFGAIHPGLVTITGADPVYEWQRLPGVAPIYVAAWDHMFVIDTVNGKPVENHPAEAPLWGRAEQVIADNKQLLPCLGLDALKQAWQNSAPGTPPQPPLRGLGGPFAGSFAVDTTAKKLYVWMADGSDPGQHRMQASSRGQIFGVNRWQQKEGVSYVQVKGIRFLYGASFPQRGAVTLFGSHNLVEDCEIDQMAGTGIDVDGTLRNCVVTGCGHTGGCAGGDGFSNENDVWIGNSWKPIDRGWEAGGVKLCAAKNGSFNHCLFRRNGGPGLWFDVWVHDVRVTNCVFQDNEGCGLFVEISHHIKADHNLSTRNALASVGNDAGWGDGGMVIAESEDCEFSHNTCIGNRFGIGFREQGPRDNDTDTGHIAFHDARDTVTDNLLEGNRDCELAILFDNGFFGRHPSDTAKYPTEGAFTDYLKTVPDKVYDPVKQRLLIDFNCYASAGSPAKDVQYGVPWRIRSRSFGKAADFAKSTGFELHSEEFANGSVPKGSEAGWAGAPNDANGWIKQRLPAWLCANL